MYSNCSYYFRPKLDYVISWTQYILQHASMEVGTGERDFPYGIFDYGLLGHNILVRNSLSDVQKKYIYRSIISFH